MESGDRVTYSAGTLSSEALAVIAEHLKAIASEANDAHANYVAVRVYELDALLDLLDMRKRTMDYYFQTHQRVLGES